MSTPSTALAERPAEAISAADALWNAEQQRAIREMLIPADRDGRRPSVSDAQMALFGEVCQRTGLDPFLRQCYLIPTGRGLAIHIGVDGLRLIGQRTGAITGVETFWCGPDGEWRDVWLADKPPAAAKVIVYRGGRPFPAVVTYREFAGRSPNWQEKPAHQLAIVAERHAWRKACQHEIAGYSQTVQQTGAAVALRDDLDEGAAPAVVDADAQAVDADSGEITSREEAYADWLEQHELALERKVPHAVPKRTATASELLDAAEALRQALAESDASGRLV